MKKLKLDMPSPAMVVGVIACLLALGGGAVAAKKAKNKIGSGRIKDGAITMKKLKKNAVATDKIADNAVTTPKIAAGERSEGFATVANGTIALPANADTTVGTLNLPTGGKYVVNAQVSVESATADTRYTCQLKEGATVLTSAGEQTGPNTTDPSSSVALTAPSNGGAISVTCNPANVSEGSNRIIDATRVNSLTVQ